MTDSSMVYAIGPIAKSKTTLDMMPFYGSAKLQERRRATAREPLLRRMPHVMDSKVNGCRSIDCYCFKVALMSRKDFLAITALFFIQTGMPVANAVTGPTLKPIRLGQSIIWRGKKYTAIKSGKKLIWKQGAPVTSRGRTPAPSPTSGQPASGTFPIDLAAAGDVPNGETRIFYPRDPRARGKGFVITREANTLIAFDVNCTHETCTIDLGIPHLVCYCHLSYFNRISGVVEGGPAIDPLRSYLVKEVSGRIVVSNSY